MFVKSVESVKDYCKALHVYLFTNETKYTVSDIREIKVRQKVYTRFIPTEGDNLPNITS